MIFDHLSISDWIYGETSNMLPKYNSSCSAAEVKKNVILVRSALPYYEKKIDTITSSVSNGATSWEIDRWVSDFVHHFWLQGRDK